MKEKIFIINFFDKNEMKWYEKDERDQNPIQVPSEFHQEHRYEHTKWYHETGKPPIEAPISNDLIDEFVQIPPLLKFEEFEEFIPFKESEK